MQAVERALEELRRLGGAVPRVPTLTRELPDPAMVQATADLLAARCSLYDQQAGHSLIPLLDRTLRSLLEPTRIGGV